MASYKRFEDTPAWRLAQDFAFAIFDVTKESVFKFRGDLVNQLRRASLSISNNIAEGFARGTTKDFINFLYIARGSCAETRSMIYFALKFPEMDSCRKRLESLLDDSDRLGKQLLGWIDSLQNTEIEGMRTYTDERREEHEKERASSDMPKSMSAMEFEQLIGKVGFEAAMKERSARMTAWLDAGKEAESKLEEQARAKGAPICEKCGSVMVMRHSKTGSKFWGCSKYPKCDFTKNFK